MNLENLTFGEAVNQGFVKSGNLTEEQRIKAYGNMANFWDLFSFSADEDFCLELYQDENSSAVKVIPTVPLDELMFNTDKLFRGEKKKRNFRLLDSKITIRSEGRDDVKFPALVMAPLYVNFGKFYFSPVPNLYDLDLAPEDYAYSIGDGGNRGVGLKNIAERESVNYH